MIAKTELRTLKILPLTLKMRMSNLKKFSNSKSQKRLIRKSNRRKKKLQNRT